MAGLSAAARARELGATPLVHEKGTRPGGSMLLSSCVIWRFREWENFRAECPTGDEALQRVVWERLDDGIAWLELLGAPAVAHETGNPRTVGKRFDPRGLTEALMRAAGTFDSGSARQSRRSWRREAFRETRNSSPSTSTQAGRSGCVRIPGAVGDGMRHALERGAELSDGLGEFYGRNMPDADFAEEQFVPLAQLYGRAARVYNERGEEFFEGEVSGRRTTRAGHGATARRTRVGRPRRRRPRPARAGPEGRRSGRGRADAWGPLVRGTVLSRRR